MKTTKQERLEVINNLILFISSKSRRFFYCKSKDRVAEMKLINNRVYFTDDYTGLNVYAYPSSSDRDGFSHGGTLWALVCEFSEYIRKGGYINGRHGYGGLYSEYWGYDEESHKEVIEYAKKIGYLRG